MRRSRNLNSLYVRPSYPGSLQPQTINHLYSPQVLTWVLFSIALVFFTIRLIIRFKLYGRLHLDDALVALSLLMLAANSILQTAFLPYTFTVQSVRTQHAHPPRDFSQTASTYSRAQWAIAYLFFTGIWAVKGSFLAFYDQLTTRLPKMRKAWYAACAVTVLTYIGSLFAYAFLNGPQAKRTLRNKAINYQFAADFSTDVISTAPFPPFSPFPPC